MFCAINVHICGCRLMFLFEVCIGIHLFLGVLAGRQYICTQYWKLGPQSVHTFMPTGKRTQSSEGSKFAVFVSNGNCFFLSYFSYFTILVFSNNFVWNLILFDCYDICADLVHERAFIHICWFWWGIIAISFLWNWSCWYCLCKTVW
jgi:hypothetical protein